MHTKCYVLTPDESIISGVSQSMSSDLTGGPAAEYTGIIVSQLTYI